MRPLVLALVFGAVGCEIAPVEARSMDWNVREERPARVVDVAPSFAPSGRSATSASEPATSASSVASPAHRATPSCGKAGTKPCPLQAMMRGAAQGAVVREDYAGIERAFLRIAAMQPPGYAGWADLAQQGAKAAREHDKSAVGAACSGCHGLFREKFRRSDLRAKPLQ
jgi:hypothetical protein